MTDALNEFVRTGVLGPIRLGLSRDSLRTMLGEPGDWSVDSKHPILKYGDLELTFLDKSTLTDIHIEPRGAYLDLPIPSSQPFRLLECPCKPSSVLETLLAEGIVPKVNGGLISDDWINLRIPQSNLSLTLDGDGCLASIDAGSAGPRVEVELDTRWWSSRVGGCRLSRRSSAIRSVAIFYHNDEYVGRSISAVTNGLLVEEGPVLLGERDISAQALGELVAQLLSRSRRDVAPGTLDLTFDQQGDVVDPLLRATMIQPAKRFYRHAKHVIVEEHANRELHLIPMDLIAADGVYSWPGADRIRRFFAPSAVNLGEVLMEVCASE